MRRSRSARVVAGGPRRHGAPTILMYHRVAAERLDPRRLCVSATHFDEHLQALRRHARVLPLAQLQRRIVTGDAEPGSVAITFDDGYADNLLNALPLLARHDTPATVFVTTGYLGGTREFWWDELERLLLEPGALPKTVVLPLPDGEAPLQLVLGGAVGVGVERIGRRLLRRASASAPPSARVAAYRAAWARLLPLHDAEQRRALEALREATGRAAGPRPTRRQLTESELLELGRDRLVEIGAHTVTHPALPLFPAAEQRDEITASVATLSGLLGAPVRGFSYPHGRFTDDTVRIVRDAGLEYACAASPGPHGGPGERDPLLLGRLMVTDVDADALLRMLAEGPRAG